MALFTFKFRRFARRTGKGNLDPDEIFLDSSNLPSFDNQQFEGRLERPIDSKSFLFIIVPFSLVILAFIFRLYNLQIVDGRSFFERSMSNNLKITPVFSERGVIYDRNGKELAWNGFGGREYIKDIGLSHLVGYVGYPTDEEIAGGYYHKEFVGRFGSEEKFNFMLRGKPGFKIIEVDAVGVVHSENTYEPSLDGEDLMLSVDSRINEELYRRIENLSKTYGYVAGAGVLLNLESGEVIAIVNYPEFDSNILSGGSDVSKINSYLGDERKPLLNRAVSGLYTPGSVIKPIIALGALNEKIIDSSTEILSTGSISIPNQYFPDKFSVFNDWKAHGYVDMKRALAVSSNVYFYEIGGGHKDLQGLGIYNINMYANMFGLGAKTGIEISGEKNGVVPSPEWKKENFDGEPWFVGNTYHTSIGQYGFQVTPVQIARAIGAIGKMGKMVKPTIIKRQEPFEGDEEASEQINLSEDYFEIVREGMRLAVLEGTATGLNIYPLTIAAKTGSAEVGVANKFINSWVSGFFPYDDPNYSFAVVMEKGPRDNLYGSVLVMNGLFNWMLLNTPEYFE